MDYSVLRTHRDYHHEVFFMQPLLLVCMGMSFNGCGGVLIEIGFGLLVDACRLYLG